MYAHTHALHVGYSDVRKGIGMRRLESPGKIQMYCSDGVYIYRTVYEVQMHMYICWATVRILDY